LLPAKSAARPMPHYQDTLPLLARRGRSRHSPIILGF
jgi:hypothetical protein